MSGLQAEQFMVRIPEEARTFHQSVQNRCGADQASYSKGTGSSFPVGDGEEGGKAAGAQRQPITLPSSKVKNKWSYTSAPP